MKIASFLVLALFITVELAAQTFLQLNYTPPPVPSVFAGNDTTINQGDTVYFNPNVSSGTLPFTYQWAPADSLFDPAILMASSLIMDTTIFTLTVIDSNNCIVSDEMTVNVVRLPDNIEEILTNQIAVYPNPSDGLVTLQNLPANDGTMAASIYDISGQLVKNLVLKVQQNQAPVDLSEIPTGNYIIAVKHENEVSYSKIIIR